ncbi:MAG: CCA tRNA nucleotidyltransferase [Clostridia bacterium]|nr:CCA tRNA nucleotidyltransferase [Clostridia bacterium]
MDIKIPKKINYILETFWRNNFEAYCVGGSIRDSIMGIEVGDWDITTSALPEETKHLFNNEKIVDTGIKHGTVSIIKDHEPIEVTTFRIDGEYNDNRHPNGVSFTRILSEDLKRRDFTVNSIAYSKNTGIIDLYGGINDIQNKIIRTVGEAETRFNEDGLRIMRALRFASTLNFTIEEKTKKAIHKQKKLLKNISVERISIELNKLLLGDNAFNILTEFADVFAIIIPEIEPCIDFKQIGEKHAYDVWTHICHTVDTIPKNKILKLTMLLHDLGKIPTHKLNENGDSTFKNHATVGGEMAKEILTRLRFDKKTINRVSFLVSHHDFEPPETKIELKKKMKMLTSDDVRTLLTIKKSDRGALSKKYRDISKESEQVLVWLKEIEDNNECVTIDQLKVNGNDLIKLGLKNEEIGEKLDYILDCVIEEKVDNTKQSILTFLS